MDQKIPFEVEVCLCYPKLNSRVRIHILDKKQDYETIISATFDAIIEDYLDSESAILHRYTEDRLIYDARGEMVNCGDFILTKTFVFWLQLKKVKLKNYDLH